MDPLTSRPWHKLYDTGLPANITAEYNDMLSLFRATVSRAAEKPAVHYFDRTLTYGELDRMSDALAVALLERGVTRGDRVMLVLQNVPQFSLGFLAAWKIGAIAVPTNPMYRERELRMLLTDCEPKAMIAHPSFYTGVAQNVLSELPVSVVITTSELDFQTRNDPRLFDGMSRETFDDTLDLVALLEQYDGREPPAIELTADDTATIVYTSGTTGAPKGAMNSHSNLAFNAQMPRDWMGMSEGESTLGVAPLFHITGLQANTTAILNAAPMVLTGRFEPGVVLDAIEEHRPDYSTSAITALIALMNHPNAKPEIFNCFKLIFSGGAPVPLAVVEELKNKLGINVRNAYGLTETTAGVTITPAGQQGPVDPEYGALSVGVPVFNVDAKIIDDDGNAVGFGEAGELLIRGPQVISGYWRRPDDDSFTDGWFHTGDIAVMDEKGWIYLIDRKKDMINASGYKVWPRDVEDVLYSHPAVMEAAVVPSVDPYRGETVKAVLSLKPGTSADAEELIAFCKERMAAYKYPRIVEFMSELPKTPTGKILRRSLRDKKS